MAPKAPHPGCFATQPHIQDKPCEGCPAYKLCLREFLRLCEFPTAGELAQQSLQEKRDRVSVAEVADYCSELSESMHGIRRNFAAIPAYRKALESVLGYCESNGVDPRVYLRSQFIMLRAFVEAKKFPIQPNMLFSKGAVERYRRYAGERMENIGTLADLKASPWGPAERHELLYASTLVLLGLAGKYNEALAKKHTCKAYPGFTPGGQDVRHRVLPKVLDQLLPFTSRRVVVVRREFQWRDVAEFLRRWVP